MLEKIIRKTKTFKKVLKEADYYNRVWQEQTEVNKQLRQKIEILTKEIYDKTDVIQQIKDIIKKEDKRNKTFEEINKILKGVK